GAHRRAGFRVTPTVTGNGPAKLLISYLVGGARWYPAYDLQLNPSSGRVQVSFAGLVSQETGEDWSDARLTLSTAVPATTTQMPKIFSWKIGELERFIPTPAPMAEYARPAPPAPAGWRDLGEESLLRNRLLAAAGVSGEGEQQKQTSGERSRVMQLMNQARAERDVVKLNCLDERSRAMASLEQVIADARRSRNANVLRAAEQNLRQLGAQAEQCIGELAGKDKEEEKVEVAEGTTTASTEELA